MKTAFSKYQICVYVSVSVENVSSYRFRYLDTALYPDLNRWIWT